MATAVRSSQNKIRLLKKLLTLRELWRWEGKTVVFTNGVFDILHAGHVGLLEKARGLGDLLIVGLNSDASVKRLGKGTGRPINKWRDRATVLCALSCVDAVVAFAEDTPAALLQELRPDVLVKGGDYRKDQVAGRSSAGSLVILPLKKGYSTTNVLSRLREAR